MTDKLFAEIWSDTTAYNDPDAFASDWALSSSFGGGDVDLWLFEQLRSLWGIRHLPFTDLLGLLGLGQSACSRRFCIPLRTVQHWANGDRDCPDYLRLMMAEAVGALTLRQYKGEGD